MFKEFWLPMIIITTVVLVIVFIPLYIGSCKSAEIYNKQNGTSWSCGDFFWAGEQINSNTQTVKVK